MPIYNYVCTCCKKELELIQKIEEEAPRCCEGFMKKVMSKGSFILKGQGWYRDGYSSAPKGDKK